MPRNKMTRPQAVVGPAPIRCAIYTRKSTDEGLDQDFNTLQAQREAAESYIASQRSEGWIALPDHYDDGGFSGGTLERPALQRLLRDIDAGLVQCVVVYKLDRLSRSLLDFTKMVDLFDQHNVTFVSVTQAFNTTTSMGRLTLNILLSFAQFEREIIGERIRDKVAAAKRKGKYMGGPAILGYDLDRTHRRLVVNLTETKLVQHIFQRFVALQSTTLLAEELNDAGYKTKSWTTVKGRYRPGNPWDKGYLYRLLNNHNYIGQVIHQGNTYKAEHEAIISHELWDKAHAILASNYHSRAGRVRSQIVSLLRDIIKCGHCGTSMGVTWSRRRARQYRYYLCQNAAKHGYENCPIAIVPAGEIENAVVGQLRRMLVTPEIIAQTVHAVQSLAGLDAPQFDEQQVAAAMKQLHSLWENLFPREQERIVRLLVNQVILTKEDLEIAFNLQGLQEVTAEILAEGTANA